MSPKVYCLSISMQIDGEYVLAGRHRLDDIVHTSKTIRGECVRLQEDLAQINASLLSD